MRREVLCRPSQKGQPLTAKGAKIPQSSQRKLSWIISHRSRAARSGCEKYRTTLNGMCERRQKLHAQKITHGDSRPPAVRRSAAPQGLLKAALRIVHNWRALLARTAEGGCPHVVCEL